MKQETKEEERGQIQSTRVLVRLNQGFNNVGSGRVPVRPKRKDKWGDLSIT